MSNPIPVEPVGDQQYNTRGDEIPENKQDNCSYR